MNKRNILRNVLAVTIGLTLSAAAFAATRPPDYRRTLFVPVGQKTLVLEAPQGMCFLNESRPFEEAMYNGFQGALQKKGGDRILLAVFAACNGVANLTVTSGANDIHLNYGVVTRLNQPAGETRQDYLDMRASAFPQYVLNSPAYSPKLRLDKAVHRTEYGVSLAMSGEIETGTESEKQQGVVILAATTIRHMPIEFMFRAAGKKLPVPEKIYLAMDTFIAQQIALNE